MLRTGDFSLFVYAMPVYGPNKLLLFALHVKFDKNRMMHASQITYGDSLISFVIFSCIKVAMNSNSFTW